jgi:histidinol-phosphate aminotransferase
MADHPRPTPKERVREIEAYVPGKSGSGDCKATAHKLSANESPLGPSPIAVEALRVAASKIGTYPEGSATHLREAIADVHGLDPTRIVCSNGSDEMLSLLAKAYMTADGEGIVCKYGFALYKSFIRAAGGRPITVRESDEHTDIDAVLEAVTTATKMVYVANPNNPTGTYISSTEVCRLHAGLPKTTLLVLDAAYAEYVHRDDYDAGIALVASSENVVMTRTFSKAYGAAGLRVGWMYGPAHIVDTINKVRPPLQRGRYVDRRGDRSCQR